MQWVSKKYFTNKSNKEVLFSVTPHLFDDVLQILEQVNYFLSKFKSLMLFT